MQYVDNCHVLSRPGTDLKKAECQTAASEEHWSCVSKQKAFVNLNLVNTVKTSRPRKHFYEVKEANLQVLICFKMPAFLPEADCSMCFTKHKSYLK